MLQVVDPSHFWASSVDVSTNNIQLWLFSKLNESPNILKPLSTSPQMGKLYAAPYSEGAHTNYYRARVESIQPRKKRENSVQVISVKLIIPTYPCKKGFKNVVPTKPT